MREDTEEENVSISSLLSRVSNIPQSSVPSLVRSSIDYSELVNYFSLTPIQISEKSAKAMKCPGNLLRMNEKAAFGHVNTKNVKIEKLMRVFIHESLLLPVISIETLFFPSRST